MDSVLIRYHEIALKKGNRAYFTEMLKRNILASVKDLGAKEIRSLHARLLLTFRNEIAPEIIVKRISSVFGVANFSLVERTERDIEELRRQILIGLDGRHFTSFRIETQRGDKTFPLNSPEINRQLGAAVKEMSGARVDLTNPEFTVSVEVLPKDAFFGFNKIPGPGGLPVGASGRLVSLISGGFDSPVAAYRMMQRGCRVIFVHFHSAPYQDKTSQDKVRESGQAADPPSISIAPLHGSLRRDPTADCRRRGASAARGALPAHDAAHRREDRPTRKSQSARHRREPGPSGIADAR